MIRKDLLLILFCISSFLLGGEKMGLSTIYTCDQTRQRPIFIEVWYPVDQNCKIEKGRTSVWKLPEESLNAEILPREAPYPLVIMSHGMGGERRESLWLAEKLVSAGYIVASVEHYGDSWDFQIPDLSLSAWNRPLDISFAIDRLTQASNFSSYIDPEKIGFVGFSMGGMTGIWLAGGVAVDFEKILKRYQFFTGTFPDEVVQNLDYPQTLKSYTNNKVKAFVFLAPSTWGFNEQSLKGIDVPSLIIGAESDDILPNSSHAEFLLKNFTNIEFKLVEGKASHYVFLGCASDLGKKIIEKKFYEDHPSVNRREVHAMVAQQIICFFNKQFSYFQ